DRYAAGARDLAGGADRERKQGTENDLGAFIKGLLGGRLSTRRGPAVVLHQKLNVRILELGERHVGGVLHRWRADPAIAARRKRQHQTDLDLTAADGGALLRWR